MHAVIHRRASRVFLAVILGVLGGCENLGVVAPEPPPPAPTPAPTPLTPAPPKATRAVPPPPPPAPVPAPDLKVVGLSQEEIQSLLGQPSAMAERPPAKVWQYRAESCVVDIYFYLDVGRNAFYALHYDTPVPTSSDTAGVTTPGAQDAADRCLHRVYNARREP